MRVRAAAAALFGAAMMLPCPWASAQDAAVKVASAIRIPAGGQVRLDGHLDEAVWAEARPITDFIQKEPVEGGSPSYPTDVRIVYSTEALYVGVRVAADPQAIQAPMSRRDDVEQAEYVMISLDTYHDLRTAYAFGVTASGVRVDRYYPSDDENNYDSGFDPVWDAAASIGATGWTAELWIPFSQLRFRDADQMVWGLNVTHSIPALDERDYWSPVPRTMRAWASHFGELRGIAAVGAPHRLEAAPYTASTSKVLGSRDPVNPFEHAVDFKQRAGADMRVGFGPTLTLDAAVNPDFGQIDADPAVVNLTAFETFFSERRPFFLTGSDLISKENNFFYSRRIGAHPQGPASGDYVDYPDTSTIVAAGKLTGKLSPRTSIGVLTATTHEEAAHTSTAGFISRAAVAPPTTYTAGRVQREFGSQGSTLGVEMTETHRFMSASDPLASFFVRNAFTVDGDALMRFKDRTYQVNASLGMSYLKGQAAAIDLKQRSNVRYFQRPDGPAGRYDPTRTTLGGMEARLGIDKIGGRHWLWGVNAGADSPELETNELGRLNDSSDIPVGGYIRYRETEPGKIFRAYSIELSTNRTYDYDTTLGPRVNYSTSESITWPNFWLTNFNFAVGQRGMDQRLTRGGPAMQTPQSWNADFYIRNSTARQFRWNAEIYHLENEDDDLTEQYEAGVSMRPAPPWQLSINPTYRHEVLHSQYVSTLEGGRPETYGDRFIFGFIDRTTLSAQLRFSYTFRPDLNLDVYTEPFAASGRYFGFGELAAPRTRSLRMYGQNGIGLERLADGSYIVTDGDARFPMSNFDFNVRSFRSNVVLKWEWRPGSLLYVVWQQNRARSIDDGSHVGPHDLLDSLSAPGDNVFAVKISYWLSPR
jgi:hypothetical protein